MYITSKKSDSHFSKRRKKFLIDNKSEIANVPKNALIELTNACNHACVFCANPKMNRRVSHLSIETYSSFIEKCVEEKVQEVGLYSTGDPFMTKNLFEFIKIAKTKGILRVYITTNGALANFDIAKKCIDNGLNSIKFSINAGTKESYNLIHGHDDFEKVIKNISDIYDYKIKNNLNLQLLSSFVYTNKTAGEVEIFKKKFGKFFEEMIFFPAHNLGGRNIDTAKRIAHKFTTGRTDSTAYSIGGNSFLAVSMEISKLNSATQALSANYKPCEMLWNRLHLTKEGFLTACCVDYENDLVYEKFQNNSSLQDMFNHKKMRELRKKHLSNNLDGTICKGCLYNENSKYEKLSDIKVENSRKLNTSKIANLNERLNKLSE